MMNRTINTKNLFQYGFIALPVAFAGFPLYVLAPDFFATQYGLSLTLLGTLLLLIRLVDAVQDPLIGWFVDRLRGQLIALLMGAGFILCLSIFVLFNHVIVSPAFSFAVCMLLAVTGYSVMSIIQGAAAIRWTDDKNDQTRIAGARESFALVGLVIAVSMPTVLGSFLDTSDVYKGYTILLLTLMMLGFYSFYRFQQSLSLVPSSALSTPTSKPPSVLTALKALRRPTLIFLGLYGISMLASSIPAVLVIFYVRDVLGSESLTGVFLFLYFVSGAVGMPLWKKLSVRFGKYSAWMMAHLLAVVGFVGAFFLGAGDVEFYALVCILSGLALGADLTLPPSILSDHSHTYHNTAYAGTHYAVLAFIVKASLALASALALPLLDVAGFVPNATNTASAMMMLSVTYAMIPCVLKLVAALLLYSFFIHSRSTIVERTI